MAFQFGATSEKRFAGVHPHLVRLTRAALAESEIDFGIEQGLRSYAQQLRYYLAGNSRIDPRKGVKGRHLTGHAVDVKAIDPKTGKPTWETKTGLYRKIKAAFDRASKKTGIPFNWGGNYKTLKDYGHYELTRQKYPAK